MSILRFTWLLSGLGGFLWLSLETSVIAQTRISPNNSGQSNPSVVQPTAAPNNSGPSNPSTVNLLNPSSNPLLFPTKPSEVEIKTSQSVTLKQAIELGLKNNRDVQTARIAVESSRAQLAQAIGATLPTLNATFQLQHSRSSSADVNNQVALISPSLINSINQATSPLYTTTLQATFGLNYNVYTGGSNEANIAIAEKQIRFNQLNLEVVSEQTRYNVANAYYVLQNADAQVLIAQASVEDYTRTVRDAQLLFKAGLGTQYDILSAEVSLSTAQQSLVQAIANQKIARRQLAKVISVGQQVELVAADEIKEAGDWPLALDESIIRAYKNRAELEQQLVQKEIYQQNSIVALAGIRPKVSLFLNYNALQDFDYSVGPGQGYSVGATVNWTLYDGGQSQAAAEQAYRSMDSADVAFAKERETIREQVEAAFFNLKANKENISNTRTNIKQAEESLRLARLRFQAGVGTELDVINSQTSLTTARSQYLQAIIGYNESLNSLEEAVSNLPDNHLFEYH